MKWCSCCDRPKTRVRGVNTPCIAAPRPSPYLTPTLIPSHPHSAPPPPPQSDTEDKTTTDAAAPAADAEAPARSRSRSPQRRSRSRSPSPAKAGGDNSGKDSGVALRWNSRGFGFIKPDGDETGEDLFCHYSSIDDGNCLKEGDKVWFVKQYDDRKGKYRAEQVTGGCTEERQAAPAAGACYDFQAGRCQRGDGCRFSHTGGDGGGGGGYGGGGGKGYGGGGTGGGACYDFQAGRCNRGDGCRFSHSGGGDGGGGGGGGGYGGGGGKGGGGYGGGGEGGYGGGGYGGGGG